MDDEAATEKLAAALEDAGVSVWLERTLLADALLPVVREIAAEELREAGRDLHVDPLLRSADFASYVKGKLDDHADALAD